MSSPPALPPRKDDKALPADPIEQGLDPKQKSGMEQKVEFNYSLDDNLPTILYIRKIQEYTSPMMKEKSDYFLDSHRTIQLSHELNSLLRQVPEIQNSDNAQFWIDYINEDIFERVRSKNIREIEFKLLDGIPEALRDLVFLHVLQLKYSLDIGQYNILLKKANNGPNNDAEALSYISAESYSAKELYKVFWYYITEVSPTITSSVIPKKLFSRLIAMSDKFKSLEKGDIFAIIVHFNKIFNHLSKEEFYYKANRSLEDLTPDAFKHIVKQGINLKTLFKNSLFGFFAEQIEDSNLLLKLLDFIVFEGFDFYHRLIVAVFSANSEQILKLNGKNLDEFLFSRSFFEVIDGTNSQPKVTIRDIIQIEPEIIKYENEFHLLHSVSVNKSDNELTSLKDINDELIIKIQDLKKMLENLKNTHSEIISQGDTYYSQLEEAKSEGNRLRNEKANLNVKYENLTMKENLNNTIKANKEFADRNVELDEQISSCRKRIETKKLHLSKSHEVST